MNPNKAVILAKIESSYGVDPTPTVAANALLVNNVSVKPNGESIERQFLKSSLSNMAFVRGYKWVELSFDTELKGTGTRGALPSWGWEGVLARACGMSETVTGSTSIVWAPVSSSFESCAIYLYEDGIFHKILGCRGSYQLVLEVGKYPVMRWTFQGIYAAPTDATPAAQTFSSIVPPVCVGTAFTFAAVAACINKLELDVANELSQRLCMSAATGLTEIILTGRKPRGSLDPETVTEATLAWWNKWETAAQSALVCGPIGSTSGNIITINAPKVQQDSMGYGSRGNILTYEIPILFAMNAGDDEFTITIT
jgi:hypothetical protein